MDEKILVVTDTTSAMDVTVAKEHGIALVSLSVIIEGVEYKDQIDMSTEELYACLAKGASPTTSQPNQGYVQELMKEWKKKEYEAIIIIACSSDLSGAWSGFNLAKETLEMDNVHIIDSRQIGSPIMDMVLYTKKMADQGSDIKEILDGIQMKIDHSFSFLYPETFTQLKRGGRLSPTAAKLATMLKIKAMLYLKEDGTCVEKFAMTRTELKALLAVVNKFKELGVNAKEYRIYLAHANNLSRANKIKEILAHHFEGIEFVITQLPAVLTCHGGLGCVSIHSTYKL